MNITNDLHFRRDFGCCKISWRIERFFLQSCMKNWEICSPEFSVKASSHLTSWKMILKPTTKEGIRNDYLLSVFLERLESDPGPSVVQANWKLKILNCKRQERLFTELEYLFKKSHRHGENVENMNCLLTDFKPFEIDDLHIQCHLIVNCEIDSIKVLKCSDVGLRSLSDDLHILYRNGYDPDMVLKIKNKEIPANKAILYARNSTLASIIDGNPEIKAIDLCKVTDTCSSDSIESYLFNSSFINIDAVERLVDYIYSGRLEEVISKPSVTVYESAILLDINEVIGYYVPDELFLNTAVDCEEHLFFWVITDFESRNDDYILSPPLTEGLMKSIWRLKLFPKVIYNNEEYVSLYAEIHGERIVQEACLEFAVMDYDKKFHNFRRLQKSLGLGEILGFDDFIQKKCLENSLLLQDGNLHLIFKLRTFRGQPILSSGYGSVISVLQFREENNFLTLSEDLADLFRTGKFSDAIIQCNADRFKVHNCIMVARSDNFHKIAQRHRVNDNVIRISDIKSNVLRIVLVYMYSGTLDAFNSHIIHEVYLAAIYFGIDALINVCSKRLVHNYLKSAKSASS